MASIAGPHNPIAWAQFQRKGGTKNLLSVAGGYVVIIAGVIYLTAATGVSRDAQSAYAGWSTGLLALQSLFVVVIGAGRVSAMIRGDITSGIIESHRMMPIPAGYAVAGYLAAAAAQMSGLFAANLLLGTMTTLLAGLPVGRWVMANLILATFAVFLWTIAAFAAFLAKGSGAILAVSSMAGLFGNAGLLYVAPGLIVLLGPLIGGSIFNLRTAQTEVSLPLVLSVCAQALVGSIFFAGAARKFRRPEALALGGWLAELLLLAFVALSVLAIVRWQEFQPGFLGRAFRGSHEGGPEPLIGSMVMCMIIAVTPLTNFAREHITAARARADDPDARRRRGPGLLAAGVIVVLTLALLMFAAPLAPSRRELSFTLAAFWGFAVSLVFLAAWLYRVVDNAKVIVGVWLVLHCLIPLGADLVRHGIVDEGDTLQVAASISPIGLLVETWTGSETDLRLGAGVQLLLPLIPMLLYWRKLKRRRGGSASDEPVPTPPPLPAAARPLTEPAH